LPGERRVVTSWFKRPVEMVFGQRSGNLREIYKWVAGLGVRNNSGQRLPSAGLCMKTV
jgi:hypothetical protein